MNRRYLLLLLALLVPGLATAQTATSNSASAACALGSATTDLAANNVRARLYNNGGLFWKGAGNVYNVPVSQSGTPNAIFAAGIWMGGKVNGEIRTAAADYGNWELWPGPLDASGNPPADCAPYDRIFKISKLDVAAYEANGTVSDDLRDWPWQWGAPVVDGDGNPDNYDLAAGDRPEILGHETHWWVMNDAAGSHATTGTNPIGMEVQATASGVSTGSGALSNTTFYRYKLTYRGTAPLTDAYFGFWVDPDLGNATDDWVGSDTTLDMGFVYNADNNDDGSDGYGNAPPALGITFLEAPEGGSEGLLDVFLYYGNSLGADGNPRNHTTDWYNYLQGVWQDGKPMVTCGNGYNVSGLACAATAQPTKIMWPGDPVTGLGWSEINFDGAGNANPSNDRRFLMSTGPFTMQPGATEEIVFAIVWARGDNNIDSVTRLRQDAQVVRDAWAQTGLKDAPAAAITAAPVPVAPADGSADQPARLTFYWQPVENASNYDIELRSGHAADTLFSVGQPGAEVDLSTLGAQEGAGVQWRVRGRNPGGVGPWSAFSIFITTGEVLGGTLGGFENFLTVANASGPLDPPEYGAFAFNDSGFPHPTTADRPDGSRQQSAGLTDNQAWGVFTNGSYTTFDQWAGRVTRDGANTPRIFPNAFEWRFAGSSVALRQFEDGAAVTVPFELWNVGTTPADPSDDYRMIPVICETGCGAGGADNAWDIGGDGEISGGTDDPISDAVYWYDPKDRTPGTAGYDAYAAAVASGTAEDHMGDEVLARIVLMGWNFGSEAPYPQLTPEPGTIFRIVTSPPDVSAPVLSGPPVNTEMSHTAATLYWQQPEIGGAQTLVQVARDADFTDIIHSATTTGTSHNLWGLTPGTTYHWRVRQQLAGGSVAGPWSEASSFSVSATATGVAVEGEVPQVLTLGTVAPNPVREQARLRFGLPTAGSARVALYDVLGREVQVLADESFGAGWHSVGLETGNLASGVYFVRVVAGGEQQVQAVVVAR